MKFATIGTNWITDAFIEAAQQTGKWELYAVHSRTAERARSFAETYGVDQWFTSVEELAATPDIDAVYIASPNALHQEQVLTCIQHQKHVIVEKPCFQTLDEFDAVHEAAKAQGVYVFEAARHIHEPEHQLIHKQLSRVGDLHGAVLVYAKYSSRYNQVLQGEEPNIFSLQYGGGSLVDLGIYPLYTAVSLFGVPKKASYSPTIIQTGADGGGPIVLTYDNFAVTILQSKISTSSLHNEILGANGTLSFDAVADIQSVQFRDNQTGEVETLANHNDGLGMGHEATAFARVIAENDVDMYKSWTTLSRQVLALLCELRHQNGLYFAAETAPEQDAHS
ncbi:Gfo/Idh/MocA family oxidoreductase [Bacillaceae bacterium SIJ1]|uniref:Gfo/Idh/MocA family protein n=1 Tax=Litoribacterium kuwaitense TaxID=1398745 RepID=UPI0013EBBD76|nr:Gfo/Idh/MocA family oxidoreductase [Litoribacterium kuwaitense]NGP45931.1 Gfo/Idh/MocA family oxidoreductase [Litoribacterium kuwaitense]